MESDKSTHYCIVHNKTSSIIRFTTSLQGDKVFCMDCLVNLLGKKLELLPLLKENEK